MMQNQINDNKKFLVSTAKDSKYFQEVFCNNSLTSRRRVLLDIRAVVHTA